MKIKDLDKVVVDFKRKRISFIDREGNMEEEKLDAYIHLPLVDALVTMGALRLENIITRE